MTLLGWRGLKTKRKSAKVSDRSQKRGNGWYVFADTHLGLAPNRDDAELSREWCDPERVGQFVNWLGEFSSCTEIRENDPKYNVRVGEPVQRIEHLGKPQKLIMLGDMQDIWDSTDREVEFCSRPVFNLIEKVDCEKTYITGNHDYAMHTLLGRHQSGKNPLNITEKPYYVKTRKESKNGRKQRYLFPHGMEFSPDFVGHSLWKHLDSIRSGSLVFGGYGNVLVAALVLGLLLQFLLTCPFGIGFLCLFLATLLFESFCRRSVVVAESIAVLGTFLIPLAHWLFMGTPTDPYLSGLLLFRRVLVLLTVLLFLVGLIQPLLPEAGLVITPLMLWLPAFGCNSYSGIESYLLFYPLFVIASLLFSFLVNRPGYDSSRDRSRTAGVALASSLSFFPLMVLLAEDLGVGIAFWESLALAAFLGIIMWQIPGPSGVKRTHVTDLFVLLSFVLFSVVYVSGLLSFPLEDLLSSLSYAAGVVLGPPLLFIWLASGFPRLFYTCGIHLWRIISKARYKHEEFPSDKVAKWVARLNTDLVTVAAEEDEDEDNGAPLAKEKKGLLNGSEVLVLVYGHTHIMSQFQSRLSVEVKEKVDSSGRGQKKLKQVDILCVNVPSWVVDRSKRGKHKQELRNSFLYIDPDLELDPDHGVRNWLFLGWDWENQRPFHIPWDTVKERYDSERVDGRLGSLRAGYAPDLLSIGWPYKMVAEWVGWQHCIFEPDKEISKDVLFGKKTLGNGEELLMTPCCHMLMHRKHTGELKKMNCPKCHKQFRIKELLNWREVIQKCKQYNKEYRLDLTSKEIWGALGWQSVGGFLSAFGASAGECP